MAEVLLGLGQEHAFLLSYAETVCGPDQAPAHCSGQFVNEFPNQRESDLGREVQQFCDVKTSCTPGREETLPDR